MSNEHDMTYNSSRSLLIMPEYGRNIQKLVRHIKAIEDREERQAYAEQVVKLMMQMNPQNKSIEDNREKLWKHLFRIAEYDIDIKAPLSEMPTSDDEVKRPDMVEYPKSEAKFRHYGSNVQKLIKKAVSMEDPAKQSGFVTVIGSYMKLAYRTWNREHYVSDEVIKSDLESLSEHQLKIDDSTSLDNLTSTNRKRKRSSNNSGHGGSGHNNGSNNYRNKGKGRRRK